MKPVVKPAQSATASEATICALTGRGRTLLALSAGFALAGLLSGLAELYALAACGAALVGAARAWLALARFELHVDRVVRPARLPVGAVARVHLRARNASVKPSGVIEVRDPFVHPDQDRLGSSSGEERCARFAIAPLQPGEHRSATYNLPTSRRGRYRLGPMVLELRDPLGLTSATKTTGPVDSLVVYPQVVPLSDRWLPSRCHVEAKRAEPVSGIGSAERYGLREYVSGDDLRHVHWPSTARLGQLVIRQPEDLFRGRMSVVVDLRRAQHDLTTLEASLSAAASLAVAGLRHGLEVKLLTSAGVDSGFITSLEGAAVILDLLASASCCGQGPLPSLVGPLGEGASPVVITTDRAGAADLSPMWRRSGAVATVVIFERPDPPAFPVPGPLGFRGFRQVRIPPGGSFRSAWERVSW